MQKTDSFIVTNDSDTLLILIGAAGIILIVLHLYLAYHLIRKYFKN